MTLPMHACPHGCGARLGISSSTEDGERGRCGQCRGETVYQSGQLRVQRQSATLLDCAVAVAQMLEIYRQGYTEIDICNPATGERHRSRFLMLLLAPRNTFR